MEEDKYAKKVYSEMLFSDDSGKDRTNLDLTPIEYMNDITAHYNRHNPSIQDLIGWEEAKARKWRENISETDLANIILLENAIFGMADSKWTLVAHGSTTYGKKDYGDIDVVVVQQSAANHINILFDKSDLTNHFFIHFAILGGLFTTNYGIEVFKMHPNNEGKVIDLGQLLYYRGKEYVDEEYETASCDGRDILKELRKDQKPYVPLIVNGQRMG